MEFLKRRRTIGQTASEYMVMISVISVMLLGAIHLLTYPGGPVQAGAMEMSSDLENSMQNTQGMKVQ